VKPRPKGFGLTGSMGKPGWVSSGRVTRLTELSTSSRRGGLAVGSNITRMRQPCRAHRVVGASLSRRVPVMPLPPPSCTVRIPPVTGPGVRGRTGSLCAGSTGESFFERWVECGRGESGETGDRKCCEFLALLSRVDDPGRWNKRFPHLCLRPIC